VRKSAPVRASGTKPWLDDPLYLSPWLEPDYIAGPSDPGSFLMGSDPAWSPSREGHAAPTCPRCHRPHRVGAADDPIEPGEDRACASCLGWGLDWRAERARARSPEPMLRPVVDPREQRRADGRSGDWSASTRERVFRF